MITIVIQFSMLLYFISTDFARRFFPFLSSYSAAPFPLSSILYFRMGCRACVCEFLNVSSPLKTSHLVALQGFLFAFYLSFVALNGCPSVYFFFCWRLLVAVPFFVDNGASECEFEAFHSQVTNYVLFGQTHLFTLAHKTPQHLFDML